MWGVVLGEPSSQPYLGNVGDVSRFVWNFLAIKQLSFKECELCLSKRLQRQWGNVCQSRDRREGCLCHFHDQGMSPAYSTRLKYDTDTWEVLPHNSSDTMGEADPVWTRE
ncbi:hypothetical protein P3S67_026961 [Capsicum chacoense]